MLEARMQREAGAGLHEYITLLAHSVQMEVYLRRYSGRR